MNYILLTLTLALLAHSALLAQGNPAQDTTDKLRPNVRMAARAYGDSVVLRWGTTTDAAWKVANSAGYTIERIELQSAKGARPIRTILTPRPIKPLTIDEWKARYRPEDTLAGAAVQTLYGKTVASSDDPFGSIYEMYIQQRNMHGFGLMLADMSPSLADGLGLRFVDRNIDRSKTYIYRVYSLANHPDQPIDTATVVIAAAEVQETPNVESLTASEGEKEIVLKWNKYEHAVPFSGYFVERSTDGGKSFQRLDKFPFIAAENSASGDRKENGSEAQYQIKLEENYRPAQYRVVGFDAFGETSPKSRVITAMGRDRTAPRQALIDFPQVVDGTSLKITWTLDTIEGDMAGFRVGKGVNPEGPFEPIGTMLSKDAREFTDRNVRDLPEYFYIVTIFDTAGNSRNSIALRGMFPDSIPPAIPSGLAGDVDSNGVVRLRWNANGEGDLKGYRVFYANQDDHEYQQLTTDITNDTTFSDTLTLRTLSKEIYYRVVALDNHFNHSKFTPTLTLKKPDVVAPAPPLISDMSVDASGITLAWKPSPSSDVVEHVLYRRVSGDESWNPIAR
ncbi:MAG: fibronectin type III domain-containing protein, partial [Bacteroidota bacterium]